jgi:hypothetical protein
MKPALLRPLAHLAPVVHQVLKPAVSLTRVLQLLPHCLNAVLASTALCAASGQAALGFCVFT